MCNRRLAATCSTKHEPSRQMFEKEEEWHSTA